MLRGPRIVCSGDSQNIPSPMNCSLILEEYIRENRDLKKDCFVAFLDAKAAFDVVNHSSLMRKLFHIGVEGVTWNLIHSLHKKAQTVVRWCGRTSEPFVIYQGVRQGGVLSTDLYKVYSNPLLDRILASVLAVWWVRCVVRVPPVVMMLPSPAMSRRSCKFSSVRERSMVGWSDFCCSLSKVWSCQSQEKTMDSDTYTWTINGEPMPVVQDATHMGIKRSAVSNEPTVEENIKKARKTMYSLMGPGLHGHNGLDPETAVQLYQIYVLPTLLYGLELILPEQQLVDMLEQTNKNFLKHILSLPTTTADCAVYILTGTIPLEGIIHKRALSLFGNVCRQHEIPPSNS